MRKMNCIACDKPAILNVPETNNKYTDQFICYDCDIRQWDDGYAFRTVGKYRIEWLGNNMGYESMKTAIFEGYNRLAVIDGWKLFDIKTQEQIEKLLVLI